jgi:hypothetical protein
MNNFSIQTTQLEDAIRATENEIAVAKEVIKVNTAKIKKLNAALTAVKDLNKELNPDYHEGTTCDTVVLDDMGTTSSISTPTVDIQIPFEDDIF